MDEERWMRVIGLNVWTCRKAIKMTQERLAAILGTSEAAVSRIETGKHLPSLKTLVRLAEALGVGPCRLLEEPKKSRRRP